MSYLHISDQAPTITDWIQTGVYILTAVGLFINFWYQRRNLQEQNRLRFIEEERDRRAIMPYFEFTQLLDAINSSYQLTFIAQENPGKFLLISPLTNELHDYFKIYTDFKKDEQFTLDIPVQVIEDEGKKIKSGEAIFKIDYMDKISRPYVQMVHLTGSHLYLSDPIEYLYIKMIEDKNNKKRFWPFRRKKKSGGS